MGDDVNGTNGKTDPAGITKTNCSAQTVSTYRTTATTRSPAGYNTGSQLDIGNRNRASKNLPTFPVSKTPA